MNKFCLVISEIISAYWMKVAGDGSSQGERGRGDKGIGREGNGEKRKDKERENE